MAKEEPPTPPASLPTRIAEGLSKQVARYSRSEWIHRGTDRGWREGAE